MSTDSVATLITELGGSTGIARMLDVPLTTVSSWQARNSIPADRWVEIVEAATRDGKCGITYERLARLHKRRARGGDGRAA